MAVMFREKNGAKLDLLAYRPPRSSGGLPRMASSIAYSSPVGS
jgi:hypothetical protein